MIPHEEWKKRANRYSHAEVDFLYFTARKYYAFGDIRDTSLEAQRAYRIMEAIAYNQRDEPERR
jgi:hypothetical protein